MHPSIATFSSAMFYDNLLMSPAFIASQRQFPTVLNKIMPCNNVDAIGVRFINIGGRCNEMKGESQFSNSFDDGASAYETYNSNAFPRSQDMSATYRNEAEAMTVVSLIKKMLQYDDEQGNNDGASKKIGVISPYNGQVYFIKSLISTDEEILSLVRSTLTTIEVNSVDSYQGRECDVIIFSAVRSNHRNNVGFLSDWRRFNVALTRAKFALLVVGDIETLAAGNTYWGAFQKWCEGTGCIYEASSLMTRDDQSLTRS